MAIGIYERRLLSRYHMFDDRRRYYRYSSDATDRADRKFAFSGQFSPVRRLRGSREFDHSLNRCHAAYENEVNKTCDFCYAFRNLYGRFRSKK